LGGTLSRSVKETPRKGELAAEELDSQFNGLADTAVQIRNLVGD